MSGIHFVVDEVQKVHYRSHAGREGKSLGARLREAADEKLAQTSRRRFASPEELQEYLAGCWERAAAHGGPDREPNREETKKLILDSKIRGPEECL